MKAAFLCCALVVAVISEVAIGKPHSPDFVKASTKGALAKVRVSLVSDEGNPVSGARVQVRFGMLDEARSTNVTMLSDENGDAIVEGVTCGNYLEITASCQDYYTSSARLCFVGMGCESEVLDGRWLPLVRDQRLVLRKIRHPTHLMAKGGAFTLPSTNEWHAFDLMVGDWVGEGGHGLVKDVEMRFEWSGDRPMEWKDQTFTVRFPEPPNGCIEIPVVKESLFPYSYAANANGNFSSKISKTITRHTDYRGVLNGDSEALFRIRSTTNAVGEISSCIYGRFTRMDFGITRKREGAALIRYEMNPMPNDTNLEPKR